MKIREWVLQYLFWQLPKKVSIKEQPEPEVVLFIPRDKVRYIFELLDFHNEIDTHISNYTFWKAIAEIFPEVVDGQWVIKSPNALNIVIEKVSK